MFELPAGRPAIMGVLNVTPDSFSDGGSYPSAQAAIDAGVRMVDEGADLVDVGGESTRPGAEPVSVDEELRRIEPVVAGLARHGVVVSIDTSKAAVARLALDAGAAVVNDVTALGDPRMAEVCASFEGPVCLMHMKGEPLRMQDGPSYDDVVSEVEAYLRARATDAEQVGIAATRIWIDPGIGFGKTVDHNLTLLRHLDRFVATGYPVLLGVSRKGFIGRVLGGEAPLPVGDRLPGALAIQALAQRQGVRILRVHDVKPARQAVDMAAAVLGPVIEN